jgi:hypothetical protein
MRIGIPNDISMQKCRKLHEPNENHAIPIVWSFQQVSGQKKPPLQEELILMYYLL